MRYEFRWNRWNIDYIAAHGVAPDQAEYVVEHARRPYPTKEADRFMVKGQTTEGQWLQVAYVFDPPGVVYVIHARPLTDREKRQTRRRHR
jgi:uncharacterized DUF497 family protein